MCYIHFKHWRLKSDQNQDFASDMLMFQQRKKIIAYISYHNVK